MYRGMVVSEKTSWLTNGCSVLERMKWERLEAVQDDCKEFSIQVSFGGRGYLMFHDFS